jgi:transposase InsO family protein
LASTEGDKPKRKPFRKYPIGYFHMDIAEVRTEEGKLYLFVAIDRTSKFSYVELHPNATRPIVASLLRNLIAAVSYRIHIVLTDNGIQFTNFQNHKYAFKHIFDRICEVNGIEHHLTRVTHPWINGQVERMHRTFKEATVDRYYYVTHDQFRDHLSTFVMAYNFAKRIKTLNSLTLHEFICSQ